MERWIYLIFGLSLCSCFETVHTERKLGDIGSIFVPPAPSPTPTRTVMEPEPIPVATPAASQNEPLEHPLLDKALVLYNKNSPEALEIAQYYIQKRGIPLSSLCEISLPTGNYASMEEFLGARKKIIESCLCPNLPDDSKPSPCNESKAFEISQVSKISHLVLIRGIPHRLTQTGYQDDFEDPSLDYLLGFAIYRTLPEILPPGNPTGSFPLNYGLLTTGISFPDRSYLSQVNPAVHRQAVVGRMEGLSAESAKVLIDRTILAEENGIDGNVFSGDYVQSSGTQPHFGAGSFLRDLVDEQKAVCQRPLTGQQWLAANHCRSGDSISYSASGTSVGAVPGFTGTVPNPINMGMYFGPDPSAANQKGFNGNFGALLAWRKTPNACTQLCKDLPLAEQESCRSHSKDFFKELNSDCVGVNSSFIGHQVRSYPVQYYGVQPPGWTSSSNGSNENAAPMLIETGGYQDALFTDTRFIRFGGNSPSSNNQQCFDRNGQSLPCKERVVIQLGRKTPDALTPAPIAVNNSYTFELKVRHRQSGSPNGTVTIYILFYRANNTPMPYSVQTLNTSVPATTWQTSTFTITIPNTELPASAQVSFDSKFTHNNFGYIDLDAIELNDQNSSARYLPVDIAGFVAPYINNVEYGDWAANIIDRLGGIAWWGSGSHFLTMGFAFADSKMTLGAFLAGRSLGESVWYGGTHGSGTFYGDPLYSPSAAKIYIGTGQDQLLNESTSQLGYDTKPQYVFYGNQPATYEKAVFISALHGRAKTKSTRWELMACNGIARIHDCQWLMIAGGTAASMEHKVTDSLIELVSDENVSENIFLKLKVWNIGEESQAIFNIALMQYLPTPPLPKLKDHINSISVRGLNSSNILTGKPIFSSGTTSLTTLQTIEYFSIKSFDGPGFLDDATVILTGIANPSYTFTNFTLTSSLSLITTNISPIVSVPERLLLRITKPGYESAEYPVEFLPLGQGVLP